MPVLDQSGHVCNAHSPALTRTIKALDDGVEYFDLNYAYGKSTDQVVLEHISGTIKEPWEEATA